MNIYFIRFCALFPLHEERVRVRLLSSPKNFAHHKASSSNPSPHEKEAKQ
jgi:hypothetical protein